LTKKKCQSAINQTRFVILDDLRIYCDCSTIIAHTDV